MSRSTLLTRVQAKSTSEFSMLVLSKIKQKPYWALSPIVMLTLIAVGWYLLQNRSVDVDIPYVDEKSTISKVVAPVYDNSLSPSDADSTEPVAEKVSLLDVEAWADTQVDGELKADAAGNLIIDLATRDYLDYMFSAVGDLPAEQVLAMIEQQARQKLPPSAVSQLLELIDDYLAFQESVVALTNQNLKPASEQDRAYYLTTLDQTFAQLKLLRRTHMSADAVEGFFKVEEAYSDFTLANMQLQMRNDLTSLEKQQAAENLRQQLPQELSQSVDRRQLQQQRHRQTQDVLTSEMSDQVKRQQLSELHSPVMVEKIMSHQKNELEWKNRLDQYQQQQQQLLHENASEEQQQRLLQAYFPDEQEQNIARTHIAIQQRTKTDN